MENYEPVDRREQVRVNKSGDVQEEAHIITDVAAERRQALDKVSQFIWLVFGVIEGLIGLRFLFKLIAANPNTPFTRMIYNLSALFVAPFNGITSSPSADGIVLEISSLIAILIYALTAIVLVRLVWLMFDRPSARTISTVRRV